MRENQTWITIRGTRLRETDKAVQFSILQIGATILDEPTIQWFPFSQTGKSFTDPKSDDNDTIMVTEWILEQKELI